MTKRSVHYEAAFEDYLRRQQIPYVAVDEAKRATFGRISLKSFDFVVYSGDGPNLLVDIKGRKFPDLSITGKQRPGRKWENWVTQGDIDGLTLWAKVFGEEFAPMFVFAYWLQGPPQSSPFEDVHFFRESYYAFAAMKLDLYVSLAKPRSVKWKTVTIPSQIFADNYRPLTDFL